MTVASLARGREPALDRQETLDDVVIEVIEDLALRGRARCIVCGGQLVAYGHEEGRCPDCGGGLS